MEEIHVSETLSSAMIVNLLEKYPNLEKITCPPSIYNRISKNYINALEQLDIKLEVEYQWGNTKQSCDYEDELLKLASEGYKASQIAEILDINVNRVYYLLRRNKKKLSTNTKKHDYDKVRKLYNENVTPKEISEQLNIPLRSVYYILNKK